MDTYYDTLGLKPSASRNEIDAACEHLYLHWKGLVTHHDPAMALKANQTIQQIETMRTTLMDPSKRSIYDQTLNQGGVTGGLVDIASVTGLNGSGPTLTPPPPDLISGLRKPPLPAHAPGMWACPKPECGVDNPPQTKFCFKCGTQLVQDCPNCGKTACLIATQRCGECGFSLDMATERRDLRKRQGDLGQEIERLKRNKNALILEKNNKQKTWIYFIIGVSFLGIVGLIALGSDVGMGLFLLLLAGVLAWVVVQMNPSRKFDPQIQGADDQIRGVQETMQRVQGAYTQLADER